MWNKNWKTYKQHKLSNRSKQIKDLHNHTNSRQNQSKHRMPANVSVKGTKTKQTFKIRGKKRMTQKDADVWKYSMLNKTVENDSLIIGNLLKSIGGA